MGCKFINSVENNDVCDESCKYYKTCTRAKDPKWQEYYDEKIGKKDEED